MQHPNIPPRHHMNQLARLNVSYLDEVGLKGQDVRVVERECLRCSLPLNLPVLSSSPAVAVDEEGEVGVVEQELAVQALDVDWLDVLFSCDEVKRGIGLVQERLALCGFERYHFKATGAADAES